MLADAFGAKLHGLHVIQDPLAMGWGVDAAYCRSYCERTERNVREQLESPLTLEEREKFHVESVVDTGTQGRGTVERMWVGSVTQGY